MSLPDHRGSIRISVPGFRPTNSSPTSNFGVINGANDPRILQIGARFSFGVPRSLVRLANAPTHQEFERAGKPASDVLFPHKITQPV